ncbi:MAG: hypothetical protein ACYDH9_23970 [Limisphaerales bacterium]
MKKRDLSSELTWKLSAIMEDCKRIEPALAAYLKESDMRPPISEELLRILSSALAAYDLAEPDRMAGEFHGLPREACLIEKDPEFTIRHEERPADWDFQPWLLEKLNAMQAAAKGLAEGWLTDLRTVTLHRDAPMTPREWLRSGIMIHFAELKSKATVIFQEVCMDKLKIEPPA